ncbi:MAG: hypothetical protein AB1762_05005 [Gemmatimonadota bacterium]
MTAKKKKPKPKPSDKAVTKCVARKFAQCMDDALLEGKTKEQAVEGCKKALDTMFLLCKQQTAST